MHESVGQGDDTGGIAEIRFHSLKGMLLSEPWRAVGGGCEITSTGGNLKNHCPAGKIEPVRCEMPPPATRRNSVSTSE
jgi:hypothetical protein